MRPGHGLVSPDRFVPVAEEIGLIEPIGLWVLETACKQLKQWHQHHYQAASIAMSINISKRQLMQNNFIATVGNLLSETELEPGSVKL